MIVILKQGVQKRQTEALMERLKSQGLEIHFSQGRDTTLLGLIGDTSQVDIEALKSLEVVADVKRVSEPYKLVNRKYHTDDTVVMAGGVPVGGEHFTVFAGPCSVESEEQIIGVARRRQGGGGENPAGRGATSRALPPTLSGGCASRASSCLLAAKRETGLPICHRADEPTAARFVPRRRCHPGRGAQHAEF